MSTGPCQGVEFPQQLYTLLVAQFSNSTPNRVVWGGSTLSIGWGHLGEGVMTAKARPCMALVPDMAVDVPAPKVLGRADKRPVRCLDTDIIHKITAINDEGLWDVIRWVLTVYEQIHSIKVRINFQAENQAASTQSSYCEMVVTVPINVVAYPNAPSAVTIENAIFYYSHDEDIISGATGT